MLFEAFLAATFAAAHDGPPAPGLPAATPIQCPAETRLVEGVHVEYLQRYCLDYQGGNCLSFHRGALATEGWSLPVRTCMDRFEWPNREGAYPEVMVRFVEAEAACAAAGKRLCTEAEWEVACEGPEHSPWPYGWVRDGKACINDKPYRGVSEAKLASRSDAVREAETRRAFQAEPSGSRPTCTSAFGVVDLVGNVEEWVRTSRPEWRYESSLKGGYWSKAGSGCRGTNDSHGPQFRFYETGFRCCVDPT